MSYKIRSVNENESLWTNLVNEMEDLENRDEMTNVGSELSWCADCCFQI